MAHAQDIKDLLPKDAQAKRIAGDMKFIEGPCWTDADGGYLVFSDIPAAEIKKWDGKSVSTFREFSNNANGNTRDLHGRLISCEHTSRCVTRLDKASDGKQAAVVLVHKFQDNSLNSPNDVVVKSDGTIWFTDPTYGIPKGQKQELDGQFVFRFDPDTQKLTKVANGFDQPNGLCFSPDEKKMYIADSGKPHHIRAFDVHDDNTLTGGDVFAVIDNGVPDGIRCDEHGDIWSSAGDGVHVISPEGKVLTKIAVPESPANLCFGGSDGKTLFITARTSLYSVQTNVKGAVRPQRRSN
jgi:gluconolactonase